MWRNSTHLHLFLVEMSTIELKEPSGLILICGTSGSGKTNLIYYLLRKLFPKYNHGLVIYPDTDQYYDIIPAKYIFNCGFDKKNFEACIGKYLDYQMSFTDKDRPTGFLVIDDASGIVNLEYLKDGSAIDRINKCFRHLKLIVILVCHYINKVNASLRNNAQYTFLFKQDDPKTMIKTWENYGGTGAFNNFEEFNTYFNKNTALGQPILRKKFVKDEKERFSKFKVPKYGTKEFSKYTIKM